MQDKKIIILAVLGIFAVISLARGVMTPPKYKSAAVMAAKESQPQVQQHINTASMQRRAKRTEAKILKRNPFAPASSGNTSTLVLNGVIWNKDRPKAMIGDTIVTRGDSIAGNKVVDIRPDKVILNDGVKNFELKMEK
jgi:hypothetical protein